MYCYECSIFPYTFLRACFVDHAACRDVIDSVAVNFVSSCVWEVRSCGTPAGCGVTMRINNSYLFTGWMTEQILMPRSGVNTFEKQIALMNLLNKLNSTVCTNVLSSSWLVPSSAALHCDGVTTLSHAPTLLVGGDQIVSLPAFEWRAQLIESVSDMWRQLAVHEGRGRSRRQSWCVSDTLLSV